MIKVSSLCILLFYICSCNIQEKKDSRTKPQKKIYIYSMSNDCAIINWYCYSTIGGFSSSKIEIRNRKNNEFKTIESYYISDIKLKADTLRIQLWANDTTGINLTSGPCFKTIQIDTTGDQNKNGIDARISRIISAKIDYSKPHNFDSKN